MVAGLDGKDRLWMSFPNLWFVSVGHIISTPVALYFLGFSLGAPVLSSRPLHLGHARARAQVETSRRIPRRTPEPYLIPPSFSWSWCGECQVSARLMTSSCSHMWILCVCAEYSRADVVLGVRFRTCRRRAPKSARACPRR